MRSRSSACWPRVDTVIVTEEPSGGSPTGAPGSEPLLTFNIDSGENTGTSGIPA